MVVVVALASGAAAGTVRAAEVVGMSEVVRAGTAEVDAAGTAEVDVAGTVEVVEAFVRQLLGAALERAPCFPLCAACSVVPAHVSGVDLS